MAQQIKSNNKNNKTKSDVLPIKLAFQANIFKYVEKKKRQLSIFGAKKNNQFLQNRQYPSISSNLIKQSTAFNFYNSSPKNTNESEMLLSARIKLVEQKTSNDGSILKQKTKGHKSSLSDWRILYHERKQIAQKHLIKKSSPDKMAVTDRLFYPSKKQFSCVFQKSCSRRHIKQQIKNQESKFYVSDQNFFHMYHRSVTPILSDLAEKKRITKYLQKNKERRQSSHGLRLINEGILSDQSKNDFVFVPYNLQSYGSYSKLQNNFQDNLQENLCCEVIQKNANISNRTTIKKESKPHKLNLLNRGNTTQIQRFIQGYQQPVKWIDIQNNFHNNEQENLELSDLQPKRQFDEKYHINLSELFPNPEQNTAGKKEQVCKLRLKLFKPRQNKIQKGILNTKKAHSDNKFANFQYSGQYRSKINFLNTTKYFKTNSTK